MSIAEEILAKNKVQAAINCFINTPVGFYDE